MRHMLRTLFLLSFAALFALPAIADKCKDPIVDEVSAFSSGDAAQINASIAKATAKGADVRVQVLSSFHNAPSLLGYKNQMMEKCASWQAKSGTTVGMKNNLVLVLVVPKKQSTAVFYGDQWRERLGGQDGKIVADMNAHFRDGKLASGVVVGIDEVTDLIGLKRSEASRPVTIVHAADNSGLWNVFGWGLGIIVVGLLVWLGFFIFRKKGEGDAAQRAAQTARGKCSEKQNGFEVPYAALRAKVAGSALSTEWNVHLNDTLDRAKAAQVKASGEFSALGRSANNPDTPRLSVAEYEAMERNFSEVFRRFATAEDLLTEAQSAFARALRGDPIVTPKPAVEAQPASPIPQTGQTERAPRATSGKSSSRRNSGERVVVHHHHDNNNNNNNGDFVTGVIVGQALGHHDHERVIEREVVVDRSRQHRSDPVIADIDPPSRGGGNETTWGETSRGEGVEAKWGGSSAGGGNESKWGGTSSSSY